MNKSAPIFLICFAAILIAGCATGSFPASPSPVQTVPVIATSLSSPSPEPSTTGEPASQSRSGTSLTITASPDQYTPMMSSTVGVGITVDPAGFDRTSASYLWTASDGEFLSWRDLPDYTVTLLRAPVITHGEKIFWSFTGKAASTDKPVTITVTAKDSAGTELGTAHLTLAWDGDNAVIVQKS